jgi:hypothetical protein
MVVHRGECDIREYHRGLNFVRGGRGDPAQLVIHPIRL